jgi:succinate-semialdehyde dehydrogenase / glutarate-semialdehyde dehydrogenase
MPLESINPATGDVVQHYNPMPKAVWVEAVEASHVAWVAWRTTPLAHRSERMRRAAALLRERRDAYAALMAREMGKPLAQGRAEIDKCADTCVYYAEHAAAMLAPEPVTTEAFKSFVSFQPLGVVLAVMPWNFPFWQVIRFAAPALMAGNAGVLKHAANVTGCALELEALFRDAGFPPDLFRTLLIETAAVEAVIAHPRVRAVTLTGSTGAGRAVASQAGRMLKKTVLELGGSDAYVILEDADIALAAQTCVASRLINAGQSCIAAKRFIVVDAVREAFEKAFVEKMKVKKVGSPLETRVDVGPLARIDLRDSLHKQVTASVEKGARLLLGGEIPPGAGAFYPPTVLTDVRSGMPAYEEELFGPVAAIIPAADEADALRIANGTSFGLGAAVFTRDIARGERIATQDLEAGACFVNDFVRSDPRLPFGGVKESGYGRELSSYGLREFVNIKSVVIQSANKNEDTASE